MNGWSWRLGRFFGIDTEVHATFLLLIGWAAFSAIDQGGTLFAAALSVLFLLAVFGSVLLHELGHALTARLYGIETRRITLSPLGGIAQLDSGALSPRAELWVALAGPLTSFALAGLFFTIAAVTGSFSPTTFVGGLAWANLMLAAFNMLPAFPMDGGRVFRAALAKRVGYRRATEAAVKVGRAAAVGMMLLGLFTRPLLILVGAFVYFAAGAELRAVRSYLGGGGGLHRAGPSARPSWYHRWRERLRLERLRDRQRGSDRGRGHTRRQAERRARRTPEQVIYDDSPLYARPQVDPELLYRARARPQPQRPQSRWRQVVVLVDSPRSHWN
ncbi:MAG: site-2 protease family protein [Nannocystaceae bacterium]